MSEGGEAIDAVVNEGEGEIAVLPTIDEDQGGVVVPPIVDEGRGLDHISPVMSYEKGTDYIEPVISESEIKYEGKGKCRSESFSYLPARGESPPKTAKSAPPDGQAQDESAGIAAQSNLPLKNQHVEHDCGCADIYDGTGKKRQQACNLHKLNPDGSVLSLPSKTPLSEVTNLDRGRRGIPIYTPQAQRNEESPPRRLPVVTSFKSERAIEPTGPPNTLTTIPTQDDKPIERSTPRVPDPKGEKRENEPGQGESSEDNEDGGIGLNDEHRSQFSVREGKKLVGSASGPAVRKEVGQPKSILKKTVGTRAEARQTERGRPPLGQVNLNEDSVDNRGGVKLYQDAVARLKAGEGNRAANNASGPVHGDRGGVLIPALTLDTEAGLVVARTNSKGEPAFPVVPRGGDDAGSGDREVTCPYCVLM